MRYRLRSLLILMIVVPPILAAGWLQIARHMLHQKNVYPYNEFVFGLVLCGLIIFAIGVIAAELYYGHEQSR